jgi:LDH2 family malate/lactate/ureidoglycolate dehydrogenase
MLLPIGGYKGYGLSVVIDSMCGALTGTGCSSTEFKSGNGVIMCAINIDSFTPIEVFKEKVDAQIRSIKNSLVAPGFNEILMPGEPEFRTMEERTRNGIEIADYTWEALKEAGKELGVTIE